MAKIVFGFTDRTDDEPTGTTSYRVEMFRKRTGHQVVGAIVQTAEGWETIDQYGTPTGVRFPKSRAAGEYLVALFIVNEQRP
jgi:hypothetical protein